MMHLQRQHSKESHQMKLQHFQRKNSVLSAYQFTKCLNLCQYFIDRVKKVKSNVHLHLIAMAEVQPFVYPEAFPDCDCEICSRLDCFDARLMNPPAVFHVYKLM